VAEVLSRWREGLSKTSKNAFGRLAGLLGATEIKAETWEGLESLLIQADLGVETTEALITNLQQLVKDHGLTRADQLRAALRSQLRSRLPAPPEFDWSRSMQVARPAVILVVGVNGSGKTTTIAKLACRFLAEGKTVLLGAADTFRAAAVDQLQVWGKRLGIEVIAGAPEGDAGAVAFSAVQAGMARGVDVILIDTAGRLHTRFNLMEELKKVHRVMGKAMPGAPHAVWLVLDATTGQNGLQQVRHFTDAVNVTGLVLTKLDGTAKGGIVIAIGHDLKVPVRFIGVGEKIDDLQPFNRKAFVEALFTQ
jgi:fused signal recognition particle receptor